MAILDVFIGRSTVPAMTLTGDSQSKFALPRRGHQAWRIVDRDTQVMVDSYPSQPVQVRNPTPKHGSWAAACAFFASAQPTPGIEASN